jgi:hypothetical protein
MSTDAGFPRTMCPVICAPPLPHPGKLHIKDRLGIGLKTLIVVPCRHQDVADMRDVPHRKGQHLAFAQPGFLHGPVQGRPGLGRAVHPHHYPEAPVAGHASPGPDQCPVPVPGMA